MRKTAARIAAKISIVFVLLFMLCLQFSVALQNVAHIALERAADAVERRKAHALSLAATQNGKIRLRDADGWHKVPCLVMPRAFSTSSRCTVIAMAAPSDKEVVVRRKGDVRGDEPRAEERRQHEAQLEDRQADGNAGAEDERRANRL